MEMPYCSYSRRKIETVGAHPETNTHSQEKECYGSSDEGPGVWHSPRCAPNNRCAPCGDLFVHDNLKCRHRPRDVLDRDFAQILEIQIQLVANLIVHITRYADATSLGEAFEAGRYVDPVSVDIITVDDHVAYIDPNTIEDLALIGDVLVAIAHCALHLDGKRNRIDDAFELHERAVTHQLDGAAIVLGGLGIDQFCPMTFQGGKRSSFVLAHKPRVAHNISREDGG